LLVLTPEGDVLTGGQRLDALPLAAALTRVLHAFRTRRAALLEAASRHVDAPWPLPVGPGQPLDTGAPAALVEEAAAGLSTMHERGSPSSLSWLGHPAAINALLAIGVRRSDARALDVAGRWIDACFDTLVDAREGALLRLADAPGSAEPERVALLERNVEFLEALLGAAVALGREDLWDRAALLAGFLSREMRHPQAGFVHAWGHGWGGASRSDVAVDRRRFVDESASAAHGCLSAADMLGDRALGDLAMSAVEGVLLAAYERGAGLAHVLDPEPRVRGLLADQVSASATLLQAFEASGMPVYRDLAEELMRSVLRKHWHVGRAALLDRVPTPAGAGDVGLLGSPAFPLAANCLAARVLLRLATLIEDAELAARARTILGSCARLGSGPDAACYALAVLDAVEE
jgi:uncharacterized protein YyaL (SSP411 family)